MVDDCVHFGQLPPLGSVLGEFCVLEVLIEVCVFEVHYEVRVLDVDLKYSDKMLFFTSQDEEEKYLGGHASAPTDPYTT